MLSIPDFQKIVHELPDITEGPHQQNLAYRVNKKIFATLNAGEHRACVKLSAVDQDVFCLFDKTVIYPVPNKWGIHGWTLINLKKVKKAMLMDALRAAYDLASGNKETSKTG
ncbi:MAG: hypothetical protein JWQ27_590 [Ferruginibacter sp.]|nr:hypothetical protein [Ferruginibacter sp.]